MNTNRNDSGTDRVFPARPASRGAAEAWVERAVGLLDGSARDLDAATLSRLNRARQAALAARRPAAPPRWLFGGGLAGAALALVVAIGVGQHLLPRPAPPAPADAGQDDLDALVGDDSPDLYENLDFYAWVDAQQDGNG